MVVKLIAPKMLLNIGGTVIIIGAIFNFIFDTVGAMMMITSRSGLLFDLVGILGLIIGIIILVAANKINAKKSSNEVWFMIALVASILSVVDGGGFMIGAFFVFLGAIIGLIELDFSK
ncbi:MAG: hypothetical protein ACP5TL_00605 [Candidatus Micrarchaeia archaeon]